MTDKQVKAQEEQANKEFTLTLTKRELTIIFNVLVKTDDGQPKRYFLGDAAAVLSLLPKLEPYVVSDSNIPAEPIVTSRKVESWTRILKKKPSNN